MYYRTLLGFFLGLYNRVNLEAEAPKNGSVAHSQISDLARTVSGLLDRNKKWGRDERLFLTYLFLKNRLVFVNPVRRAEELFWDRSLAAAVAALHFSADRATFRLPPENGSPATSNIEEAYCVKVMQAAEKHDYVKLTEILESYIWQRGPRPN